MDKVWLDNVFWLVKFVWIKFDWIKFGLVMLVYEKNEIKRTYKMLYKHKYDFFISEFVERRRSMYTNVEIE